jgi:hypothetical protein
MACKACEQERVEIAGADQLMPRSRAKPIIMHSGAAIMSILGRTPGFIWRAMPQIVPTIPAKTSRPATTLRVGSMVP